MESISLVMLAIGIVAILLLPADETAINEEEQD